MKMTQTYGTFINAVEFRNSTPLGLPTPVPTSLLSKPREAAAFCLVPHP